MSEDIFVKYTDYIKGHNFVVGFGFLLAKLDEERIIRQILKSLLMIQSSSNKSIRERRFNIWAGNHLDRFYIALPENISVKIVDIFRKSFTSDFTDISTSYGETGHMGLYPILRYENGKIIEYNDDSVIGTSRIDDENWYGTGAEIHFRMVASADVLGFEKYGNV